MDCTRVHLASHGPGTHFRRISGLYGGAWGQRRLRTGHRSTMGKGGGGGPDFAAEVRDRTVRPVSAFRSFVRFSQVSSSDSGLFFYQPFFHRFPDLQIVDETSVLKWWSFSVKPDKVRCNYPFERLITSAHVSIQMHVVGISFLINHMFRVY